MSSASQPQNAPTSNPQNPMGGGNPMNQQPTQQNQPQQQQMPGSILNPQNQGPMGGLGGNGGGAAGLNGSGMHHNGMGGGIPQMGDSYSISQSQTINFTQQTLRQRAAGTGK